MTPETLGPFTCIGGIPTERMNRAQPILDRHGVHVVEVAIGYKLECPNADAATAVKADLRKSRAVAFAQDHPGAESLAVAMSAEDETDIVVVIRVLRMLDRIRVGLPTGPEAAHDIEIESTALAAAAARLL